MKDESTPKRAPSRKSTREARTSGEAGNVDIGLFADLLGYRMRLAMNAVMADLMAALDGTGLRPVLFAMLAVVARNPGIIQTALGNALGVQRANLVPLLNELAERRLLERRPAPHDKRAYALHLTAEGRRALDEALERIHAHERRVFGRLSARERTQLASLLAKLAEKRP